MMKKIILLTGLLFLLLLFYHPQKAEKHEWLYSFKSFPPQPLTKWNHNNGQVLFSPDGTYLAATSEKGNFKIIETKSKKVIYEKDFGVGLLHTLLFSSDSKKLYLGENSPDGYIYCLALPQGKIIWQYATGKELGNNLTLKSYPIVYHLVISKNGTFFSLAGRSEKRGYNEYYYQSRVYALDSNSGKVLWKYPKEKNMQAKSNWLDTDSQGERIVLSASGNLVCLQGENGKKLWDFSPPLLSAFKKKSAWFSPSISPDGKRIGFLTGEGMVYFFDKDGNLLWQRQVSAPKEVNGIPVYAVGLRSYLNDDTFLVLISNSYSAADSKTSIPLEHPNAHSVFAYDFSGNLLWKWKKGGYISEFNCSPDGKKAICPVAKNFRTRDFSIHGAYLLDISQGRNGIIKEIKAFKAKEQGPVISADFKGNYTAIFEVPVLMPDGIETKGKYQVHLWEN